MPSATRTSGSKSKTKREASASLGEEDDVDSKQAGDISDEGEGETEEGEFEIEAIVGVEKGFFKPGRWAFRVKWKGYPDAENSWVDEPDFYAKDMIQEYWHAHPEIAGNPYARRQSTAGKPRKSSSSVTQPSKSSSKTSLAKGRKSEVQPDEEPAKKLTKRKSAKEELEDDDVVMEDSPAPAAKKSKRSSTFKKKVELSPSPAQENGLFAAASSEEPLGHDPDSMNDRMHLKTWEDIVSQIDTVEHKGDELMIYFSTNDDVKCVVPSSVINNKAPQKMLRFYEQHLRWKPGKE